MLARIIDNHTIIMEQITVPEEDIVDKEFSVRSPRAQYIDTSLGFFDGVYHKYNKFRRKLARPLLAELEAVCTRRGLPLSIEDDRPAPKIPAPDPSMVTSDIIDGITLDDHQVRAIKAACTNEVGIVAVGTGGGKTEIMAGIIKMYNCPTVVLCDMTTVVNQIKERLSLRKVVEEVGMFYAGRRPNGQQVIVGSIQSLMIPKEPSKTKRDTPESFQRKMKAYRTRRANARRLREIIGKCEMIMVDECDNATGKQWRYLFANWFKGRRRFGFSGTPFDPDKPVQNMVLKEHLGSIISQTDRMELVKIGRTIPVSYTAIGFGDPDGIKDRAAFDIAQKEHMIDNPAFHRLVANLVAKCTAKDPAHGVLILVESIPLGKTLEAMIPQSAFICGDHGMAEREEAIKAFESRRLNVLIGGKIIKRGLDLKGGCETLIIATGGKLGSDFNQKVGRAVRINKRGYAQIYDFFFLCNHYLYSHSRKRLKAITDMGYPAKVIFKEGVVDAYRFIQSRFRRPRARP